jgi:hypothetical protein
MALGYSPSLVCCGNRLWKGFKLCNNNITILESGRGGGGHIIAKFNRSDFAEWM